MNLRRTPVRSGFSHPPGKATDFTTDLRPSRTFGFAFPEQFESIAMPMDNCDRLYYDESFTPRSLNSGKHNPEESIRHSNLRLLVHPFHYNQLLAKRKIIGNEIRGDFELRPNEQNIISNYSHHD